jgi:hypothetical protein
LSAYSAEVLADSPLFYWRFPFNQQYATPSIGAHAEWLGAGTVVGYQFGWSGPGVDAGSVLVVTGAQVIGQTNVTIGPQLAIEIWMYAAGKQQGTSQASTSGFQVASGTPINVFWGVGTSGGNWTTLTGSGPLSTTGVAYSKLAWHHLVLNSTATGLELFVDGASAYTHTATLSTQAGVAITIQRTEAFPTFYAEPAVYGSPLSSSRIAAHYAAGQLAAPTYSQGLASCA